MLGTPLNYSAAEGESGTALETKSRTVLAPSLGGA